MFIVITAIVAVPLWFGWSTQAPEGTSYESPPSSVSDLRLLYDLTYRKDHQTVHDQRILEAQIKMIEEAEDFIVADLFLYNDYYNTEKYQFSDSTQRMTDALIAQKRKLPGLKAYLITDEINNSYSSVLNWQFRQLEENGIEVIVTDLSKVRDSNPLYAGYYRAYIRHFGLGSGEGWLKNPFGDNGPKVSVRNYLRLLNFKANHRKVLITDQGAMISSSNPHDGSSHHSNIAFQFSGKAVNYLLEAERAVAAFSGHELKDVQYSGGALARKDTEVQILTEDKIKDKILENIRAAKKGDQIDMGMFYLSHRDIIDELIRASGRGVEIRAVLDPNKDAFGFEKNGIPNRQAAAELLKKSEGKIQVRWYMTHGEQYHTKAIAFYKADTVTLIGGSANYTRRNLDNYNLEADLLIKLKNQDPVAEEFADYFDRIWQNRDGVYTGDYSEYADESRWKEIVYRFQEKTGLSTF